MAAGGAGGPAGLGAAAAGGAGGLGATAAGAAGGLAAGWANKGCTGATCCLGGNLLICCCIAGVKGCTALAGRLAATTPWEAFKGATGGALGIWACKGATWGGSGMTLGLARLAAAWGALGSNWGWGMAMAWGRFGGKTCCTAGFCASTLAGGTALLMLPQLTELPLMVLLMVTAGTPVTPET